MFQQYPLISLQQIRALPDINNVGRAPSPFWAPLGERGAMYWHSNFALTQLEQIGEILSHRSLRWTHD